MRGSWVTATAVGLPMLLGACAPVEAADIGRSERVAAQPVAQANASAKSATKPWKPVAASQPTAAAAPGPTAPTSERLQAATAKLTAPMPAAATGAAHSRALAGDRDAWRVVLSSVPELAKHATTFEPFGAKAADEALERGKRSRSSVIAWTIADGPIAWSPTSDRTLWVAAGSVAGRALIAVLAPQPDGGVRHEVSLVIDDRDAQVALATSTDSPAELLWSTCYGCPGEGGSIVLGDDGRARFVYR